MGDPRGPDRAFEDDPHADADDSAASPSICTWPRAGTGYWAGAVRGSDDPVRPELMSALEERRPFRIDLLYGDQQGGQRTIVALWFWRPATTAGTDKVRATGTWKGLIR